MSGWGEIGWGGGDADLFNLPPGIENVAPTNLADIERMEPVTFDAVNEDAGVMVVLIWMQYDGDTDWTMVYDGDNFLGTFERESHVTDNEPAVGSDLSFSILPAGGWRGEPAIRIRAVDGSEEA